MFTGQFRYATDRFGCETERHVTGTDWREPHRQATVKDLTILRGAHAAARAGRGSNDLGGSFRTQGGHETLRPGRRSGRYSNMLKYLYILVAGVGFEPTTFRL